MNRHFHEDSLPTELGKNLSRERQRWIEYSKQWYPVPVSKNVVSIDGKLQTSINHGRGILLRDSEVKILRQNIVSYWESMKEILK